MSHVSYTSDVGSLMYAMVCTRLDITHVVGILSWYMSKLGKDHSTVEKRVSKYLHGNLDHAIHYQEKARLDGV